MKYVITWQPRSGGSAADNEASAARFRALTREWSPSADTAIHQFVVRIDGGGGFAIVESDGPAAIARTLFRLAPLNEYTAYPVIDYEEGIRIAVEADEFRASVS
jgi:hypothetical protein